ncbi:MAG TPA: sulfatase-like hydrolase/transferase [Vicinamibacterales bacterium]|jgi:hypothetical protein|nr:sulfatase-like hydrolase/transferase [Vicinamibacterales bacterium]
MSTDAFRFPWRRWAALLAALLVLDVSLTFDNVWPTPAVQWTGGISLELAACVLVLAAVAAWRGALWNALAGWLGGLWMVLAAGRYAEVTAPALYGRDVNLYWDMKLIPSVVRMVTSVAPAWLVAVVVCAIAGVTVLLFRLLRWAFTRLDDAMTYERPRRVLASASAVAIALFAAQRTDAGLPVASAIAKPVSQTYAHQAALALRGLRGSAALAPSPSMESSFENIEGADVFLIFVESYGALTNEPALAARLVASRRGFETDVRETGRGVVSAYAESPTFGGSSWLAHLSLLTGVEVRDPDTNSLLMTQQRDTLVRTFARHGARTVALMPGLRNPWPEGSFYGFDEVYGASRLGYAGPEFGWFAVPDQFSLARLDALEAGRTTKPRFVFFPTISTHFPFSPTPPYQPDWSRMLTPRPYDGPAIVRAYSRQPDWLNFVPGYAESLSYDFSVIGGYLRVHTNHDLVMILIGDHQPPAAVSGEGASWNVPIHVIASRQPLLDRLVARGFQRGLTPQQPALARMHALLPILLDAFGGHE